MASALIDSSILLKLLTQKIETVVTTIDTHQLGESERGGNTTTARVTGLSVIRDERSRVDGMEDSGTFTGTISVLTDSVSQDGSIDAITKASMLYVSALDQLRLYDSSTTHEMHIDRVNEDISSVADEDSVFGVSTITFSGLVKRVSGATIVS